MADVVIDVLDPLRIFSAALVEVEDSFRAAEDFVISVRREVRVLPAAAEEERPRRDERGDDREVEEKRVVEVDAVALPRGHPVGGL